MELSLLGIRFFLGLVFLSSSIPKLGARRQFRRAVQNYGLLPQAFVGPVSSALPWAELGCSISLLLGIAPTLGAGVAAAMLMIFALAAGFNLLRGRTIECGCSGPQLRKRITWSLVLWDFALATGGVFVASHAASAAIVRAPWEGHVAVPADAILALIVAAASCWLAHKLLEEAFRVVNAARDTSRAQVAR